MPKEMFRRSIKHSIFQPIYHPKARSRGTCSDTYPYYWEHSIPLSQRLEIP